MKRNTKIIAIVLSVLVVTTTIGVIWNMQYAKERLEILRAAEIVISEDGEERSRLTLGDLEQLEAKEFVAELKSSAMQSPEDHTYTGVAFSDLFTLSGISLEEKSRVMVHSVDGYAVPLKIEEIKELDNIYLVYKDGGDYLGSYEQKKGQGPYMIVIRGDRFSQRWAKYVCELDVE